MNGTKTVLGIDISMNDFHVYLMVKYGENKRKVKGTKRFKNVEKGFEEFINWIEERVSIETNLSFVMEATGTYYENLAYFLYSKGYSVSVVLANKLKNYAKSLNVKTKTDKVDSKIIAQYGIERNQESWKPMSESYKNLRDLCREILSLKKELNRSKNQLHAMKYSYGVSERLLQHKLEQIGFYEMSIVEIEKEIKQIVYKDSELAIKVKRLETIPGLRFYTAIMLVCETNGFELFKNIRQVVSYAGLDVGLKESGTIKGKSRITKKGNSRIRQVLYMPALSAIQSNEPIKRLHERICEKNPDVKRKGVVAGMRKLLILSYTLWKKEENYDCSYSWN